ncbi:hypothetical protein F5146DRAFT_1125892 [Armillaria mellea]|nr:hypothetical protein F5146DRAFT_1125892 [Armillaria mellea]
MMRVTIVTPRQFSFTFLPVPLDMSFYDGTPIASMLDELTLEDIVALLGEQETHMTIDVGLSIRNRQFDAKCGNEAIQWIRASMRKTANLSVDFPLEESSSGHSRREIVQDLRSTVDLDSLIHARGWDHLQPKFFDGTSVSTMMSFHRKATIIDALCSVSPVGLIPSDLVRETKTTIYMCCSLLEKKDLEHLRRLLKDESQPPVFPDGVLVQEEYRSVTTPILQWLCRHYNQHGDLPTRLTRENCLRLLQLPPFQYVRTLLQDRPVTSHTPLFHDHTPVVDILSSVQFRRAIDILTTLCDVPTEIKHRQDIFMQFCAILPIAISDAFVTQVKKDYHDRVHYTKRLHVDCEAEDESFLQPVSERCIRQRLAIAIDRTNNHALQEAVCVVCARLQDRAVMEYMDITAIPHRQLLRPTQPHPSHILSCDMLLYTEERDAITGKAPICQACLRSLNKKELPRLALANDLWLGHIPPELEVLTLPERILVARYFPAAYIVKLYPKIKNARMLNPNTLATGLKGNVSTYPLPHAYIAAFIDGRQIMPPHATILSALIGVTFIQPNNKPQYPFPKELHVRRQAVFHALEWLKRHNPLWADVYIDHDRLRQLPENDVPMEIINVARVSHEMSVLAEEDNGYVPETTDDNDEVFDDLYPNVEDVNLIGDQHTPQSIEDVGSIYSEDIILQANGMVDANGNEILDEDSREHALANEASPPVKSNLTGKISNRRFRKDLHFMFQIFGVMQKRNICRSSVLQMRTSSYQRNQPLISTIKPKDLFNAAIQESQHTPFLHPGVQALRTELIAVRSKVLGTDESRRTLRSKIWSTSVVCNPPNLWITINPNDTHDPIAQVFARTNIDLDHFIAQSGPSSALRAKTIAEDPFASAKFFHLLVKTILEGLFGITVQKSPGRHAFTREEGIFGRVQAYISTVEAQGRGSLHLHLLLWLHGPLTADEMEEALKASDFRQRVTNFIEQNITGDVGGLQVAEILHLPEIPDVSYSRPPDPTADDLFTGPSITRIARTVQHHECHELRCLIQSGNRKVCKRRAPFPTSEHPWVNENGEWGPRQKCGYINNFNPPILLFTRSNHDIKLVTNGAATNNLSWYLTTYTTKKQPQSSNTSAVLAKTLAFHRKTTDHRQTQYLFNKRLLQRCSNALGRLQQFSAQECIGYIIGWRDRYVSHFYIPIYLSGLFSLTIINRPVGSNTVPTTTDHDREDIEDPTSEDHFNQDVYDRVRLEFQNGLLTPRDQIGEYQIRRPILEELSLFNFLLNTYDIKKRDPLNPSRANDDTTTTFNNVIEDVPLVPHVIESHVEYLPNCGRDSHVRVIRQGDHETLPDFIGPWFPDPASDPDLHAAYILTIFKPWQNLSQLKAETESFTNTLRSFLTINPPLRSYVCNIDYYHRCLKSANQQRSVFTMSESQSWPSSSSNIETDHALNDDYANRVTDFDIERARILRVDQNERFFAQTAIDYAMSIGMFATEDIGKRFQPPSRIATMNDIVQYQSWHERLTQIIDSQFESQTYSGLFSPQNPMTNEDVMTSDTDEHHHSSSSIVAALNEHQRMAYRIIENHLLAGLTDDTAPQLLMQIQGAGGTGKTLLIRAIAETFRTHNMSSSLGLMATSGVAAMLFGGSTIHSWGGVTTTSNIDNPTCATVMDIGYLPTR